MKTQPISTITFGKKKIKKTDLKGGYFQFTHEVHNKHYSLKVENAFVPSDKLQKIINIIESE